jgi:hypothetical protein
VPRGVILKRERTLASKPRRMAAREVTAGWPLSPTSLGFTRGWIFKRRVTVQHSRSVLRTLSQ